MGASMDPKLRKNAAAAYHNAIQSADSNGMTTAADCEVVMEVYRACEVHNSLKALVSEDMAADLTSSMKEEDAEAAYAAARMDFKDGVDVEPIKLIKPVMGAQPMQNGLLTRLGGVDAAASKLYAISYPLRKDSDWTSEVHLKPLPGMTPKEALNAVDKMSWHRNLRRHWKSCARSSRRSCYRERNRCPVQGVFSKRQRRHRPPDRIRPGGGENGFEPSIEQQPLWNVLAAQCRC
eukprot:TRINITY_DN9946_c0_g1_i7.p1 TRINITY_DN9946_c0_g1~~TRINITY_DN9946_c0_g1_i7.p1  ORF type:complete len:235 (-),score=43.23 TRINITY_DN9946_c0_g1_i7:302-1006(-)